MAFLKTRIFEYDVFSSDISNIIPGDSKIVINTINAYSYILAKNDDIFRKALQEADVLLPDGFPVVTAARWLKGAKIRKIAGADIFRHLCDFLNKNQGSCFFLGSSDAILSLIKKQLNNDYPEV